MAPPQKKIEFLPENGGFWYILGLFFYVYAKIGQANGGGGRPPDPPLPNTSCVVSEVSSLACIKCYTVIALLFSCA